MLARSPDNDCGTIFQWLFVCEIAFFPRRASVSLFHLWNSYARDKCWCVKGIAHLFGAGAVYRTGHSEIRRRKEPLKRSRARKMRRRKNEVMITLKIIYLIGEKKEIALITAPKMLWRREQINCLRSGGGANAPIDFGCQSEVYIWFVFSCERRTTPKALIKIHLIWKCSAMGGMPYRITENGAPKLDNGPRLAPFRRRSERNVVNANHQFLTRRFSQASPMRRQSDFRLPCEVASVVASRPNLWILIIADSSGVSFNFQRKALRIPGKGGGV